jgi:hypothetical protein
VACSIEQPSLRPDGDFGVLYLDGDEYCAFTESIGRGALKTRFVPKAQLMSAGLAKIRIKDEIGRRIRNPGGRVGA